jgi:cell division protein ZipA
MELNLRTVLVILGGIVMLSILVDGFRRMRRSRQDALSLDVKGDFKFPEENFSAELPNGGARIIGAGSSEDLLQEAKTFRDQLDDLPVMSALDELEASAEQALDGDIKSSLREDRIYAGEPDFQHASYTQNKPEEVTQENAIPQPNKVYEEAKEKAPEEIPETVVPKAKPLNLDEHVPLLMDVEQLGDEVATHAESLESEQVEAIGKVTEHIELTTDDIKGIQAAVADMGILFVEENVLDESFAEESFAEETVEDYRVAEVAAPEIADYDSREQAQELATQAAYAPVKKPGINAESLIDRPVPSLVLVTHVVPHEDEGFCGEDILYLVNSCDLRHGEKKIFHRFEQEGGEGCVQFSMANSFNPGIFDPHTLLHERINGVSLFMSLPGPEKAMEAFEAMTEMASVIARNLGGDVHDETHSIMALQTIEHNRQLVRDFVHKQKLASKK